MRKLFLAIGVALLLSAAGLTAFQLRQERQIARRTQELLQQEPPVIAAPLTAETRAEPASSVFHTLYFPSLELTLPVQDACSEARLELSPCRYAGAAETDDLVVAGHNYAAHFGVLHRLQTGDAVCFTDLDGAVYVYRVAAVEVLPAAAVGEMTQSGADLTLFTCTAGGKNRLTFRCERIE